MNNFLNTRFDLIATDVCFVVFDYNGDDLYIFRKSRLAL